MKKTLLLLSLCVTSLLFAQTFIQAYQDRANLVSQTNISTGIQEFVSFGVKTTGSANNNNALNWLKSKYASFGYTASQIVEDPFAFNTTTSKNLVVTKTGTLYPNTYVIICAHYDSISPGANDNGSGTNVVLEAARILKDVPTEYSIKFIHFSGEEQGLFGSQHYVTNVVNSTTPKMNIRLVFNLDQVGGVAGQVNNSITVEQDMSNPSTNNAASATVSQELKNCVGLYSPLQTNATPQPAYSSDYMPFQSNNEVITGFYETNVSPYPHTANDVYANMDPVFVFNVAKAAVGALQHFAIASTTILSVNDMQDGSANSFEIYPNPATDFIYLKLPNKRVSDFSFEIFDASGKLVSKTENSTKINTAKLTNGVYFGKLSVDGKTETRKITIKK